MKILHIILKLLLVCLAIVSLPAKAQQNQTEIQCLAKAIYFETFQQISEKSRQAVAWVILNRKNTDGWPHTICGNIYKIGQFPWVRRSILDQNYFHISLKTAEHMLNYGELIDPTGGALYFASQLDSWFHSMIRKGEFIETHREGGHKFYFWKSGKKHYE